MAIGLAFVDIVGDTSRTEAQIERDMNRVLAVVDDNIDPVQVQAAVADGTGQELQRELRQDIRAVQAAIQAVRVDATLTEESRARLTASLRTTLERSRAAAGNLQVRLDNRQVIEDTTEAVVEAVRVAEAVAPPVRIETRVDSDSVERAARDFSKIGTAARGSLGVVGKLSSSLLSLGAAAQGANAAATAVAAIGPAAALAAPAILGAVAASTALKLAFVGVSDAVTAALDPSDPEAFDEALKKLSPSAKAFAKEIRALQPEFHDLQQSVQEGFFKDLDKTLKNTAEATLPVLRIALRDIASTFGDMAASAGNAFAELGRTGMLDRAFTSIDTALSRFADLPGIAVKALGQLAVAAGPALDKVASSLAGKAAGLGDKLSAAFESGGLTKAIDGAVKQLGLLVDTAGNVLRIFGNITSEAGGAGTAIGALSQVTKAIADVTGTDAAQKAFKSLFDTVNELVSTALPLVVQAFKIVGGVVTAIAPGLQVLIRALGDALGPILKALQPVLVSAAGAVGQLLRAVSPLIVAAGQLVAQILPFLTPLFDALGRVFAAMAPFVQQLADTIVQFLTPILAQLPSLINPVIDAFAKLAVDLFPILQQILTATQPALDAMIKAFVDIAIALAPVIADLAKLAGETLTALAPLIPPLITTISKLATVFAGELAAQVREFVIPTLELVTSFIRGDLDGALEHGKDILKGFGEFLFRQFFELPGQLADIFGRIAVKLFEAGENIIISLVNGIESKVGELRDKLGDITDLIPSWKGPPERDRMLLFSAGQDIMSGLMGGIGSQESALMAQLGGITGRIGGMSPAMAGVSVGSSGGPFGGTSAPNFSSAPMIAQSSQGAPNVQVFIGDQELKGMINVQIAQSSRAQGRQIDFGMRR